jgi:hypothetical protein
MENYRKLAVASVPVTSHSENWEARLLQIAAESVDAPGAVGDLLRGRIARAAAEATTQDIMLAHARVRQSIATGTRQALRCGALLVQAQKEMSDEAFAALLRVTGITPEAAADYMRLAALIPQLANLCLRRRWRGLTERQATDLLSASTGSTGATPSANLRQLLQINEGTK